VVSIVTKSAVPSRSAAFLATLLLVLGCLARVGTAQEPGVRLEVTYRADYQPGLVVLPFVAENGAERIVETVRGIVRQDLDYSDRFTINDNLGGVLAGDPVNLGLWRERGADWIVDGVVRGRPGGFTLRLVLHDVVYGQVRNEGEFEVPPPGDPSFRMAVHAAADEVVRWATGEPGVAATRIAFVMQGRGSKEVYIVDSDGENLQRLTSDGSIALSPAWSPDARRMAFVSFRSGHAAVYERDLATGRERVVFDRIGTSMTPSYSPDGRTIMFAGTFGGNTEIAAFDVSSGQVRQITNGRRFDSLAPSFSPDGRRIAFVSSRIGEPHIYIMNLGGGEATMVSDYAFGGRGYNTSPEWSPRGDRIAYHSRVGGVTQLKVVDANGGTPRFLTNEGSNEDPSWAPNGRHLVFASPNRDGGGLFVLDTVSGRIRPLLQGRGYGLPAWSPTLVHSPAGDR
jgi:TolB protein